MKKGILFTGGLALLGFASCDDGSARIGELETELNTVKQERDAASLAAQEEFNAQIATYQYQVDSLQWIIDSLTAPKGTVSTKPKPKPTTKTEETKPADPKGDKMGGSNDAGSTTDAKGDKMSGDGDKTNVDKKKEKMGTKP